MLILDPGFCTGWSQRDTGGSGQNHRQEQLPQEREHLPQAKRGQRHLAGLDASGIADRCPDPSRRPIVRAGRRSRRASRSRALRPALLQLRQSQALPRRWLSRATTRGSGQGLLLAWRARAGELGGPGGWPMRRRILYRLYRTRNGGFRRSPPVDLGGGGGSILAAKDFPVEHSLPERIDGDAELGDGTTVGTPTAW